LFTGSQIELPGAPGEALAPAVGDRAAIPLAEGRRTHELLGGVELQEDDRGGKLSEATLREPESMSGWRKSAVVLGVLLMTALLVMANYPELFGLPGHENSIGFPIER
jgi:hypothetical protein